MPRAKKAEIAGQAFAIACPACQSRISSDGRTLFEKSPRFLECESAFEGLEQIEKKVDSLVSQLSAAETARNQTEKEAAEKIRFLELQLKVSEESLTAAQRLLIDERKKNSVGNQEGNRNTRKQRDSDSW